MSFTSGLLLACDPRMERGSSGFPRGSTPRRYQRRTPEWRQALSTDPELRSRQHQSVLQSACSLTSCDLVSQGRFVSLDSTEWPDSVTIRQTIGSNGRPAVAKSPDCDFTCLFGVSRAVIRVSWGRMSLLGHL